MSKSLGIDSNSLKILITISLIILIYMLARQGTPLVEPLKVFGLRNIGLCISSLLTIKENINGELLASSWLTIKKTYSQIDKEEWLLSIRERVLNTLPDEKWQQLKRSIDKNQISSYMEYGRRNKRKTRYNDDVRENKL
jgi:hypothetical protein